MYLLVGGQRLNACEDGRLRNVAWKLVQLGVQAGLRACLDLAADVHAARGIVADQHDSQTWCHAASSQNLGAVLPLCTGCSCDGVAIDDLRSHATNRLQWMEGVPAPAMLDRFSVEACVECLADTVHRWRGVLKTKSGP